MSPIEDFLRVESAKHEIPQEVLREFIKKKYSKYKPSLEPEISSYIKDNAEHIKHELKMQAMLEKYGGTKAVMECTVPGCSGDFVSAKEWKAGWLKCTVGGIDHYLQHRAALRKEAQRECREEGSRN